MCQINFKFFEIIPGVIPPEPPFSAVTHEATTLGYSHSCPEFKVNKTQIICISTSPKRRLQAFPQLLERFHAFPCITADSHTAHLKNRLFR